MVVDWCAYEDDRELLTYFRARSLWDFEEKKTPSTLTRSDWKRPVGVRVESCSLLDAAYAHVAALVRHRSAVHARLPSVRISRQSPVFGASILGRIRDLVHSIVRAVVRPKSRDQSPTCVQNSTSIFHETSLARWTTAPVWRARAARPRPRQRPAVQLFVLRSLFFQSPRKDATRVPTREERASRKALQNTLDRSYPREPRHQVWAQNLENLYIRRIANRKKVC